MDTTLLNHIIQLRRPWLDDVMLFSTSIATAGFIWCATAFICGVFPNKRPAAWRLVLAVAVAHVASDYAFKPLFDRPRPYEVDAAIQLISARPVTFAFPSGHTAMAVAGAIAGTQLLPHSGWLWWPLAVLVGVSRVYLGVHWPSDVAGGAFAGVVVAWLVLGRLRLPPAVQP